MTHFKSINTKADKNIQHNLVSSPFIPQFSSLGAKGSRDPFLIIVLFEPQLDPKNVILHKMPHIPQESYACSILFF